MTQERDNYMRRQEADHALLDMRTRTGRQPSAGLLPQSNVPKSQTFSDVREAVFAQMDRTGEFAWPTGDGPPTTIRCIEALCVAAGASPEWFATIAPGLGEILRTAELSAFERGSADARSRAANKPGDGDMGG